MPARHAEPSPRPGKARFIVVTGLSGAGKSAAIRALEDLGYLCVDNLPSVLIPTLADLVLGEPSTYDSIAVVVDARDRSFLKRFPSVFKSLRARRDLSVWLIFLEASDSALVRRFSETRRPHPLAPTGSVIEGILAERTQLDQIKKMSDRVLDTSDLTVHQLRRAFRELSEREGTRTRMTVTLLSFGYKYGIPVESDLILDVRFLPNPYFVTELREADRQGRSGAGLCGVRRGYPGVHRQDDRSATIPDSQVHDRREELSDDLDRLYRRAAPLGRGGGAAQGHPGGDFRRRMANQAP